MQVELPPVETEAGRAQGGEAAEWVDALLLSQRARRRAPSLHAAVRAARDLLLLGPDASAKK